MFFEIILLIAAISAVATMARRRGSDTVLWGAFALAGYLLLLFVGRIVLVRWGMADDLVFADVAAWAWIGAIFLLVRFGIGASKAKPWGMWTCAECKFLNAESAIVCEACNKPYVPSPRKTTLT